ncbi:MAG: glycosyltransferase family 4 protein [Thermomicrobiales bacterium]
MHVGLIVPSYGWDDSIQIPSLSLLAEGLASKIDVTIFPLRNAAAQEPPSQKNPRIVDPGGAGMQFRSLVKTAISVIRSRHKDYPFDVFHAYWLFEPGAVATLAGRLLGVPAVVSVGGAELTSLPAIGYGGMRSRRGRTINASIIRTARITTGGSHYVLDQAARAVPAAAGRLRFAPLPVKTGTTGSIDRDAARNEELAGCLLQVGAYLPVKGQDLSVRALAELAADEPDLTLTMIGEDPVGYQRRIHDLARQLGVAGRVRLLNRIPHSGLMSHYQRAEMLLMPSRHESQGMVVLEAAVQGLPTIGSPVGVVRDLAPDAAVALQATDDFRGLAREISLMLDNEERRTRLVIEARKVAAERYGVEPVISRWLEIYREAAGDGA